MARYVTTIISRLPAEPRSTTWPTSATRATGTRASAGPSGRRADGSTFDLVPRSPAGRRAALPIVSLRSAAPRRARGEGAELHLARHDHRRARRRRLAGALRRAARLRRRSQGARPADAALLQPRRRKAAAGMQPRSTRERRRGGRRRASRRASSAASPGSATPPAGGSSTGRRSRSSGSTARSRRHRRDLRPRPPRPALARQGAGCASSAAIPSAPSRRANELAAETGAEVEAELADLSLLAEARRSPTGSRPPRPPRRARPQRGRAHPRLHVTAEGNETTLATQVLAPFLLTESCCRCSRRRRRRA